MLHGDVGQRGAPFYLSHMPSGAIQTRQFGFVQNIPQSPDEYHQRLHEGSVNDNLDWMTLRAPYIGLWDSRIDHTLMPEMYAYGIGCTEAYDAWYDSVTRRLILQPDHWTTEPRFQGTQGLSQYYVSLNIFVHLFASFNTQLHHLFLT